ncbi:uS8 family ribosomal protein [Candidatus Nesciobacter abundans]|uniref:Small ribosomal subunit protein uS8 n=1 Tax=Candidatus Nesciobacter abundans TaxID=2601668 RepID=A0A5C0UFP5_9PROT|nr:30S ribosomal protein S8 [Candidatus Nesciobacter abundans]QEK38915.1 30S ribosomal protein S8 [Candidatus Nesciobacter abundans]
MINDRISDSFSRVRNALLVGKKHVSVLNSAIVKSVFKVIQEEGFIEDIKENSDRELLIKLKYDKKGIPVIRGISRISKSSKRVYYKCKDFDGMRRKDFSMFIVTTSVGVMSDREALRSGVGGELIGKVF